MGKITINFEIEDGALANAKAYVAQHGGSLNELVSALFYHLGQCLDAPVIDPSKKILLDLSNGEISLTEATRLLGFQDAGYTLHLLADEGPPMKRLPEETVRRQAAESKETMSECIVSTRIIEPYKDEKATS